MTRQYGLNFVPVVIDPTTVRSVEVISNKAFRLGHFGYGTDWPQRVYPKPLFPRLHRLWVKLVWKLTGRLPRLHPPDPVVVEQIYVDKKALLWGPVPAYVLAVSGDSALPGIDGGLVRDGQRIQVMLSSRLCDCKICYENGDSQRSVKVYSAVAGYTVTEDEIAKKPLPPELAKAVGQMQETQRELKRYLDEQARDLHADLTGKINGSPYTKKGQS